jgi:hypothetical protein
LGGAARTPTTCTVRAAGGSGAINMEYVTVIFWW